MILTRNLISHLGVILILTQIILFTWFVSGYFHFQGFNIYIVYFGSSCLLHVENVTYENLEFLGLFANTFNENWPLKDIHI